MFRKACLVSRFRQCLSLTEQQQRSSSVISFRTPETNPVKLDKSHLGRFYSIDDQIYQTLYAQHHGFPKEFRENCTTFHEQCVLVRKPFLDIKSCVEASDLKKPVIRYMIYGAPGTGKTMTLAGLVHYGYNQEFILVHVPWGPLWTRFAKEFVASPTRPLFIDHTVNGATWLTHFKTQNSTLITKLGLKTGKEYLWSKRETTPAGSELLEIVEHGISRPAHASECIYALIAELKSLSSSEKCKTMVLVDGVNSWFYETVHIARPDKTLVPPSNMTALEGFKQAFKPDWTGGVVVCTVDKQAIQSEYRESDLPRYLLNKDGWELFDPFVPIRVDNYTSQEVQTTIDYYLERKWLQHPDAGSDTGRIELEFLSTRNPLNLMQLCSSR